MNEKQLKEKAGEVKLKEFDEIVEILGHPPAWMLRWGIVLVLATALTLLLSASLIRYPDIVPAQVVLTTQRPPIRLVARSSGKVAGLLVAGKEEVQEGRLLAVIENTANTKDVFRMDSLLRGLEKVVDLSQLESVILPPSPSLGSLQNVYSGLSRHLNKLQFDLKQDDIQKRIKALSRQSKHLEDLIKSIENQILTLKQEVSISKSNFEKFQQLYEEGAAGQVEYEEAQTAYLRYRRELENLQTQQISNQLTIDKLQLQILELQQLKSEQQNTGFLLVKEAVKDILSEIAIWKQRFLIIAPISGRVSISKVWSPQQFVNEGAELFTIVPSKESQKIIAIGMLPSAGSGKVKAGMQVNIRLESFPYREFGLLPAEVESIALIPERQADGKFFYQLQIRVGNPLRTTYGREPAFRQEMRGTAHIITEDRSLLERLFDQLLDLSRNR